MPSGMHGGGGGGSHFGGGGASGGHHYSSGGGYHGGGGFHWFFPATFILFGRRHHISSERQPLFSLVSFFLIITIFAAIISGLLWWSSSSQIEKIKVDYAYYQHMIEHAENNPQYVKEATVVSHMYNEDCGKWYYVYHIAKDEYGFGETNYLRGYTYSIYTEEEILDIPVDSIVEVAVDSFKVTKDTDSIPLDYKGIPLERDGEYVTNTSTFKTSKIVCIVSISGLVILIVLLIVMVAKSRENEEVPADTIPSQQAPRERETNPSLAKCPYCGARLGKNDIHCPDCGASIK